MNVNLVGGDGLGGSHHLAQNFLFRPAAGRANGSTPSAIFIWSARPSGREQALAPDPGSCWRKTSPENERERSRRGQWLLHSTQRPSFPAALSDPLEQLRLPKKQRVAWPWPRSHQTGRDIGRLLRYAITTGELRC